MASIFSRPRLSRPPDPSDPEYQRLEARVNFAVHVGIFAACNSCMWFVRLLTYAEWDWSVMATSVWALFLLGHGIWAISKK